MSFHRFEDHAVKGFAPHLSSAQNHLIEGDYLYFNLNCKAAGTGSDPHYHPNELLVFCLRGHVDALVGKERHIISPGTFVVIPPNARHSLKATEDADCAYLYIKDHSWGLVGVAADEAVPDQIMTVDTAHKMVEDGDWPGEEKPSGESSIVIDGLASCFYRILDALDQPMGQCERKIEIMGERVGFGFRELPGTFEQSSESSDHETFLYVLDGAMKASVGSETREVVDGDIIQIGKGSEYTLKNSSDEGVRYVLVHSLPNLEEMVDAAPKIEAGAVAAG